MATSYREMKQTMMCRNCEKKKSEMILLPCGHLCLCESCSANVKRCIICKGKVAEKMKVYRA